MRDKRAKFTNNGIVLVAIGCIALYWIAESVIMSLVFHEGGLIELMFAPHSHEIWIRSMAICLFIVSGGYSWLMFAKRRRVEKALQESEELHRVTLDSISDAVFITDGAGVFTYICPNAAVIFGHSHQKVVSFGNIAKLLGGNLFDPDNLETLGEIRNIERTITDKYSIEHVLLVNVKRVSIKGGVVLYTCRDITERKQAEQRLLEYQQQLRSLASRLSLAEENERRRIAMDLHDSVGQSLSLCKMKLEILRQPMSSDKLAEYVSSTLDMVDHTIQFVRSLTFKLSSPILYDLGIEAAIEDLLDNYQNKHGISTRFRDDDQPIPLSNDIGIFIFRSVQELLVNVLKHAQAHSIEVAIWRRNGDICVSVEDDGVGFLVPKDGTPRQSSNDGFGLFGISERMSYLGGSAEIHSEPGIGTRVVLQIPLAGNTKSEEGETA